MNYKANRLLLRNALFSDKIDPIDDETYFRLITAAAELTADLLYIRLEDREQTSIYFTARLGKRLATLEEIEIGLIDTTAESKLN
jgi:adenylate cyclase class IV